MNPTRNGLELRHQHVPSDKPVRLAWIDQSGRLRCVPGKCIDVSDRRIHIEVPEQVPLRTRVLLRSGRTSIDGSASVKYVTRCESKFILVLDMN
jgi:hypothetical protein